MERPETPHLPLSTYTYCGWNPGVNGWPGGFSWVANWKSANEVKSVQETWKKAPSVFSETNSLTEEPSRWGKGSRTFAHQLPQDVVVVLQPWDLSTSVTEAISIFLY